jgi:small-conductance mechanosensitive channel
MKEHFPPWLQDALELAIPALQIFGILLFAWLLNTLLRRLIRRASERYPMPTELVIGARRGVGIVIYGAAFFAILERLGVSGTVLWTAFTGFAAVAAVAFFAAWSVLSNIFCTLLIVTTRPFRLYDRIEILESGDKPGLAGRVIDINLIYTSLEETRENQPPTVLQIPNSLFFQRVTRRWH